jgi:hypothetical protein
MQPGELINGDDVAPYPIRHFLDREEGYPNTRLLITPDTPYAWAIVARQVSGWRCLATGEMPDAPNTNTVAATLTVYFGTGHDYLPRDQFALTGPDNLDIHLLRTVGEPATYCDTNAPNPYVYERGRYFQHCTTCTTNYRAEHFGRHPFEEH